MIMDNEQPHQELVKCVVVGDTAVGKTRLICARACNKQLSLSQLLTTHVPTVWAIDQYRIYKDVLERSWEVVDGVNVSLRLWDTFGDHEKDRRFAYGRSDVVLLCFSLTSHNSLRNCKAMWYPEIRRFCPQTPVLLVGCKNDLRYMYRDEAYLSYFRDRSPFLRAIRKSDLVMPDQARSIARELGVYYYETSVLTYYGVNEVFENAIRAALIARRQQRFWMTNLKKVQRPLLQAPYCPPKPRPPEVHVSASTYEDSLHWLFHTQAHADVIFVAGAVGFSAHRFVLAAASPALHRLLCTDLTGELNTRSASESSMVSVSTFGEATSGDFNDDTEYLIRVEKPVRVWDQLKRRSSCQVLTTSSNSGNANKKVCGSRELNHPAFAAIRVQQCEVMDQQGGVSSCVQTVVTLTKLVTPHAIQQCLQFLYTGTLDNRYSQLQQNLPLGLLMEIRQAAEFMELPELLVYVSNIQAHEEFLNPELKQRYRQAIRVRLKELVLAQGLFADVLFQLDDGSLSAHRPLLMARCDMMRAMFSGDFREGSAKVILFPGVRTDTFRQLVSFLYCDDMGPVMPTRCLDLLELANRLCLQRLVTLVEKRVVEELTRICSASDNGDVVEHCLRLLESCKLHNADQLADWCMNHLCVNYNKLCKMSPKLLRSLHPENQEYLSEHRWPPVWYLKDYDYYDKCYHEREKEDRLLFKRGSTSGGCLCFSRGGSDGVIIA
ncbi:rho-related BTB domain-containing protein 1-like isoform X1 [Macrosteles quadrilineatus]|uniref:rho-related BTB domain-containing protein 1-like isoform X1 n=1 Tax=Macrosteles quadrilineatus TaxID=74068 RepID=UPI0023E2FDC2|nr:rho-related BTB domain-containing protein 1-like isoform X1 [Macrosteles quadrilineatus]XP_054290109.1 rho-related BTB domain-containing protein 1-like isoform X1 [Macrosteles quadrilineatus]